MSKIRENENQVTPDNRIERTYNIDDRWYFELRGGGQRGPFDSEQEMQQALEEFIALQKEVSSD